jgi:glycerophosphoryl diester phosphodiesterase
MKPWPYPGLIAHRGGGALAPENTLAAIRLGQSLGYRGHEIDVKLSKDGIAFLLHDSTLERTTTGRGRSCDHTWEELVALDAGRWHSAPFRDERLPSFEEAARLLQSRGTHINVEIKPSPGFEVETGCRVAEAAAELWKDAEVPPLMSSFSFEALMAAREAAAHLPRGFLTKDIVPEDWARLDRLDATAVHTDHRTLRPESLEKARAKGLRVLVYTVNEPERARALFDSGVDSIVTDNLAEFARRFPEALGA